ncbi:hypothetical protein BC938DRAFT_471388 [Jimgerdemannia flammicorona]|uniref:ER membrane protein complex subunit 1 n=1 Tax=Jimgerdemannia flammicorona TaxID=994334 RepID=A0A433Q893_9FUNG|nr:hypothetical protein BC938DRAFT_471388 [Jimgerdemannia flammicorona]
MAHQSLYSTAPSLQAVASNAEPAVLIAHDTGLVRVNSFILKRVNAAALFKIGKDGAASLIEDLKRKGVSAYASAAGQSGPSILARVERNGEKTLGINIWDTTESPMYRAMYKVDHDFSLTGNIQSVAITIPDKNDAATFRLFLTTADGSVRFIAREGVEWSREEALADIVEAEFLDLPERHLYTQDHDELAEQPQLTEATNPLNRYILRWTTHLNELQYFPAWASARFSSAVASVSAASTLVTLKAQSSLLDSSSVPATIYRDTGGQRKFVISATRSGKVVAQDTGIKGKIAWARYFDGVRLDRVIVVRASTVKFPPVVVAIGSGTDAKGHLTTHLYRLNALTGQDFTTDTAQATQFPAATVLPFAAKQVFRLPFEEPEERNHVLAVVDESTLQLHLYPSTAETQRQLVAFAPNFYFSLNDGIGGGALKGYQVLVGSENKDSKEVKPFGTEMLWNIEFPAGEEVVAFGEKNAHEKVASMGRVLGNRNVLYKYLNPHLLAVATYAEARSALTLYLVDLVKGAILYRASHLNAGGPSRGHTVHIVQAENWVVYTFWVEGDGAKDSARGQQVVTFELFESGFENERVPSVNFSSFNNLRPYVTAQAWIFPYTVSALGATTTRNGITARDFIFVTHTGHVIGINKRFIDPRRPITSKPTNEEKEEMLIPYSPAIPDERRLFYSYNLQVLGVKRILSSPTLLESTSLVFAYGLDTYFTPVAPSKQFDVLSEDFSKTQLLLTMAALVIGIIVTRPMVRRKRVNRLWL